MSAWLFSFAASAAPAAPTPVSPEAANQDLGDDESQWEAKLAAKMKLISRARIVRAEAFTFNATVPEDTGTACRGDCKHCMRIWSAQGWCRDRTAGKELTATQIDEVVALLNRPESFLFTSGTAAWLPRHAIVFYGKNGKPISSVNVSFSCLALTRPDGRVTMSSESGRALLVLFRALNFEVPETYTIEQ